MLFIDIETLGLGRGAGNYAFLIGTATVDATGVRTEQVLMESPATERVSLERFAAIASEASAVLTFNGNTFDLPIISARYVVNSMPSPLESVAHIDVQSVARQVWSPRLGGYALQKLEESVLGVVRANDLASSEIPTAYLDFLRDGGTVGLTAAIEHNSRDVLATMALASRLGIAITEPESLVHVWDVWGFGMAAAKCGNVTLAERCLALIGAGASQGEVTKLEKLLATASKKQRARDEFLRAAEGKGRDR